MEYKFVLFSNVKLHTSYHFSIIGSNGIKIIDLE